MKEQTRLISEKLYKIGSLCQKEGLQVMSLRDVAYAKLNGRSIQNALVKEGALYIPRERAVMLLSESPFLKNEAEARAAFYHFKNEEDIELTNPGQNDRYLSAIEIAAEDKDKPAEERRVFVIKGNSKRERTDLIAWAFKDQALEVYKKLEDLPAFSFDVNWHLCSPERYRNQFYGRESKVVAAMFGVPLKMRPAEDFARIFFRQLMVGASLLEIKTNKPSFRTNWRNDFRERFALKSI
jgi:hypothetical protein